MSDKSTVAEVGKLRSHTVVGCAGSWPSSCVREDPGPPAVLSCGSSGCFSEHPLLCLGADPVKTILLPSDRKPNSH